MPQAVIAPYRIREVDGRDEEIADVLTELHRLTFFGGASIPAFDHGHWWLAWRGATPVAFARAVGRDDERVVLTTLGEADPAVADMSTLVMIGSSETRFIERPGGTPWLLTPRTYGTGR